VVSGGDLKDVHGGFIECELNEDYPKYAILDGLKLNPVRIHRGEFRRAVVEHETVFTEGDPLQDMGRFSQRWIITVEIPNKEFWRELHKLFSKRGLKHLILRGVSKSGEEINYDGPVMVESYTLKMSSRDWPTPTADLTIVEHTEIEMEIEADLSLEFPFEDEDVIDGKLGEDELENFTPSCLSTISKLQELNVKVLPGKGATPIYEISGERVLFPEWAGDYCQLLGYSEDYKFFIGVAERFPDFAKLPRSELPSSSFWGDKPLLDCGCMKKTERSVIDTVRDISRRERAGGRTPGQTGPVYY